MKYNLPRGTYDIVPKHSNFILRLREELKLLVEQWGYLYIETPSFEYKDVFINSSGHTSDIVHKEMYHLDDDLVLRPEGTAPVMRAVFANSLHRLIMPLKLWYSGYFYRHERPQKGRYRQFYQFGVECIGSNDTFSDFETIMCAINIFAALNISYKLEINTLGCKSCRDIYRDKLQEYLLKCNLNDKLKDKIFTNPFRILDNKDIEVKNKIKDIPNIIKYLCDKCHLYYDNLLELFNKYNVNYVENKFLVRGLDYYEGIVFEFIDVKDNYALCAGGRYTMSLPGVGFAIGVDRLMLESKTVPFVDVGIFAYDDLTQAYNIGIYLRNVGLAIDIKYKLYKYNDKSIIKSIYKLGIPFIIIAVNYIDTLYDIKVILKNTIEKKEYQCTLSQASQIIMNNLKLL